MSVDGLLAIHSGTRVKIIHEPHKQPFLLADLLIKIALKEDNRKKIGGGTSFYYELPVAVVSFNIYFNRLNKSISIFLYLYLTAWFCSCG